MIGQAEVLGLPEASSCRDTARWLQQQTRVTRRSATAKVGLATSLRSREWTRVAMARGELHAEQATAIAVKLARLDDERVSTHDQERAEVCLVGEARDHDAIALGRLGHEIYAHLDPDSADERESAALERLEADARAATRLTMRDDGHGTTHGQFTIPTAQAEMLRRHLHALAAPKSVRAEQGAGSYDWLRPSAEKLGRAFVDWIERISAAALPDVGGLNATVVVIGDYDALQGRVKAASLDTGARISHTQFLRLACGAGVVPMWMNASDELLAMGRKRRFHTAKQRLAAIVEQRHCQHASGCDVPGYLCHLHHREPWASGGGTDLRTAHLLCPFHHHATHAEAGRNHPMRT
ncbi:HNH endonuclease signature motif containing protein [Nocardioides secundeburneus]